MSLNGGYAMIKYNSTQEELQIAYRSKKPVLFYDENQRAHWAVIEETATQSVDEETQEPITLYEYSYRLIDEVSNAKLYLHRIEIKFDTFNYAFTTITTSSSEPFSKTTLANFIDLKFLIATGFVRKSNVYYPIFKISSYKGNMRYYQGPLGNSSDNPDNFISMGDYIDVTDIVTEV